MNRLILALVTLAMLAAPAEAGRRCRYRTYQTLYSLNGWSHSCYSCHNKKKDRDPRELIAGLANKFNEDKEFYNGLRQILGVPNGAGSSSYGYGAAGFLGPLSQQTYGEYSSYPVGGNTLLGVQQSYASHPLLDLNAAAGTLGKVVEQTNTGAQNLISGYGNFTASAYAAENQRQENIAAYQAILGVRRGPAIAAKAEVFKFQTTTEPAAQPQPGGGQVQAPQQQPQAPHPGLVVLHQRCTDCHSPSGKYGVHGTFDLSKLDKAMVENAANRVSLPPDDAKAMPQQKTETGFGPGPALTWQEIRSIQDLSLAVQ